MPDGGVEIEWGGAALRLLPDRAVWWDAERTLLIADAHLDRAATFRSFGVPAPATIAEADLDRLSRLIDEHSAQRLIVLGDFFHSPIGAASRSIVELLRRWRCRHDALELQVVIGNHDRIVAGADDLRSADAHPNGTGSSRMMRGGVGAQPRVRRRTAGLSRADTTGAHKLSADIGIEWLHESVASRRALRLMHYPPTTSPPVSPRPSRVGLRDCAIPVVSAAPRSPVCALAGHLHPTITLRARPGAGRGSLTAPCFWFTRHVGVLPAFGGFNGGMRIEPAAGDQIFLVGDGRIEALQIPAARRSRAARPSARAGR